MMIKSPSFKATFISILILFTSSLLRLCQGFQSLSTTTFPLLSKEASYYYYYYRLSTSLFPLYLTNQNSNNNIDLTNYDFSSKQGWDDFYNHQSSFEWHSSINTFDILSMIPKAFNKTNLKNRNNILITGNGNSNLPELIYNDHNGQIHITVMDYSKTCIDILCKLYNKDEYSNIDCICGDATNLEQCIKKRNFDMIIDKGLMDAIMCGEGWNMSLDKYFYGVSLLLKDTKRTTRSSSDDSCNGQFILISYKLSTSTKEYLTDVGERFGIDWMFDINDKSNDRVSFSVGTKR